MNKKSHIFYKILIENNLTPIDIKTNKSLKIKDFLGFPKISS